MHFSVIELDKDKPNSIAHEGQNCVQDEFIDESENPTSGSGSSTPQSCITETKPEQAIELSDYKTERYKIKCELCDFVHKGGNKGTMKRTRENHLLGEHFMDKVEELVSRTLICTLEKCDFQSDEKFKLTQHYINKHKILEKYVSEALERKNL